MNGFNKWNRRPDRKGKVHLINSHSSPGPHRFCSPWTPSPAFTETVCSRADLLQNLGKLEGQKLCRTCLKSINLGRKDRELIYGDYV